MPEPGRYGSYVYGVVRGGVPAAVSALSGVAGGPVRVLVHGALAALLSTVDLAEFGEPGLRRNLEHLGWLEATARAHHAVLDAVARDVAVVPLRLATVYHSDDGVRALLAERGTTFDAALSRIQGRTEWGLKAYLDAGGHSVPGEQSAQRPDQDASGTAYLRRRRTRLQGDAELWHTAVQGAEAIHRAVSAAAEAARHYPSQDGRLTGESRRMLLNAAYLLAGTDRAPLEQALARAGRWPLRVEWTGPWVPYSFVELEPES